MVEVGVVQCRGIECKGGSVYPRWLNVGVVQCEGDSVKGWCTVRLVQCRSSSV